MGRTDSGHFLYPPDGNHLSFNYRDRISVTWNSNYQNSSDCYLSLWYWIQDPDPWERAYNTRQPCCGSAFVDLNFEKQSVLAQFNFNYTVIDGTNGLYLSEFFDIDHNTTAEPITWSLASARITSSAIPSGTIATSTVSRSSPLVTTTSTNPSPTLSSVNSSTISSQRSKNRVIIGVTLGAISALTLIILLGFCLIRARKRRNARRVTDHLQRKNEMVSNINSFEGGAIPSVEQTGMLGYRGELPAQDRPTEMEGSMSLAVELQGPALANIAARQ